MVRNDEVQAMQGGISDAVNSLASRVGLADPKKATKRRRNEQKNGNRKKRKHVHERTTRHKKTNYAKG